MNEKTRKKKFLEHYFAICVEHGYCIDTTFNLHGHSAEKVSLIIEDWPNYSAACSVWDEIKQELMESLSD